MDQHTFDYYGTPDNGSGIITVGDAEVAATDRATRAQRWNSKLARRAANDTGMSYARILENMSINVVNGQLQLLPTTTAATDAAMAASTVNTYFQPQNGRAPTYDFSPAGQYYYNQPGMGGDAAAPPPLTFQQKQEIIVENYRRIKETKARLDANRKMQFFNGAATPHGAPVRAQRPPSLGRFLFK